MRPRNDCPLGDEYCDMMDKGLTLAAQTRGLCEKCIDAGLPFEDALAQVTQQEKLLTNLKKAFFPQRI